MTRFVPRRHPGSGVLIRRDRATIVFLTVCAESRQTCLATPTVHDGLLKAWSNADAWVIGAYVVMPDHLHLFCSPVDEELTIEKWITFWKRQFRRVVGNDAPSFQTGGFHHRLRQDESYGNKWKYVRANPVRAGLVARPEDWPYGRVLNELRW